MRYGIALGSNLGDRLVHLRNAVAAMPQLLPDFRIIATAPMYETAPVDCAENVPSFYNSVVEIETRAMPPEVLKHLRAIEVDLGRPNAHLHHAPRTVDLDILYADDVVLDHPDLILPHPRMTQRRFVLQPLADIRPDLILPLQERSIAALLAALESSEPPLQKVSEAWL